MLIIQPQVDAFLFNRNAAPSQWRIPPAEAARIFASKIALGIAFPAASIINMGTFPQGRPFTSLIVIDASYLHRQEVSGEEQAGIILHEIGHILNPPPTGAPKIEGEFYADYYTHHCGYGRQFASAMRKMRNLGVHGFDLDIIETRLQMLDQPEQRLNLREVA